MRSVNELIANGFPSASSSSSQIQLSENWVRASFQVTCGSGSLNGTFVVQGSNDLPVGSFPNQFTPTNWNSVGSSQSVTCSFSAGTSALIPSFETCYHWHRVQFTAGNGGNTLGSYSIRVESKNL